MSDTAPEVQISPPTEPGFYYYEGAAGRMVFLLTSPGNGNQWYAIFDNGTSHVCDWAYIEQGLGVYSLKKV